jgi:hypothetical protein
MAAAGSNLVPMDAVMAEALCYDLLRGLVPPGKSEEGCPYGVGSPLGLPLSSWVAIYAGDSLRSLSVG